MTPTINAKKAWEVLRTIRVRLTLWYVVLLAAILVALGSFLYISLSTTLHNQVRDGLTTTESNLATAFLVNGREGVREAIGSLPSGTVVILYDSRGQELMANDVQGSITTVFEALLNVAKQDRLYNTVTPAKGGDTWAVLTAPVTFGGQQVAILQVARSQQDVVTALHRLLLLMAIAMPVTLLIAIGGGLFLASRALGPIDRITKTVSGIQANELSHRVNYKGSRDEVGRLADTFDKMLNRIETAFQKQRQFTADASHELRTPLAMIASQIDITLERQRTSEEYQNTLKSLREDTNRMSQLVTQMLTLARADAGQEALSLDTLDMQEMVEHVISSFQPLAEARKVNLSCTACQRVYVVGDQTRLTQLLVNLVDNGLRYTPADGQVTVSLSKSVNEAILKVSDTGLGIEKEHLPRLFERFYRTDKARARAEGGTGLGLAICKWIVEAHGGTISIESCPGQGSTFTVNLPVKANPTALNHLH